MPVVNRTQAQLVLSTQQITALAEIAQSLPRTMPTLTVEETNVEGAIAITSKRGVSMMDHLGRHHSLTGRGA